LFGLIGPDGAGKTTAMRLLVTLLLPDAGTILFNDVDVVADYRYVRSNVGYMPGSFALYTDLTVEENLEFFASVFNSSIEKNYHLIKDIYEQLAAFKDRRAGALSGGMKQKLALCCALIHSPLALILDEPTTGVDAVSRMEFWNMLRRLTDQGITILVSTPYMEEAALCDRVGLIDNGRILHVGTQQDIINSFTKELWSIKSTNNRQVIAALRSYDATDHVYPYRDKVMMSASKALHQNDIIDYLSSQGIHTETLEKAKPDIEDCFMDLMQSQYASLPSPQGEGSGESSPKRQASGESSQDE